MGRGGRRAGTPGKAYGNRADLNGPVPVKAAPSQGYGQRAALERAQQEMPMSRPAPAAPAPAGPAPTQRAPLTPLAAPTQRPDEPLTTGIASGPGPGPEVLGGVSPGFDPIAAELRALYSRYPSEELRELLEDLDS